MPNLRKSPDAIMIDKRLGTSVKVPWVARCSLIVACMTSRVWAIEKWAGTEIFFVYAGLEWCAATDTVRSWLTAMVAVSKPLCFRPMCLFVYICTFFLHCPNSGTNCFVSNFCVLCAGWDLTLHWFYQDFDFVSGLSLCTSRGDLTLHQFCRDFDFAPGLPLRPAMYRSTLSSKPTISDDWLSLPNLPLDKVVNGHRFWHPPTSPSTINTFTT